MKMVPIPKAFGGGKYRKRWIFVKKHKKPLAPGWARLTAVLLALVTLWLVPVAAFGAEGPVTVQLEAPQVQDAGIASGPVLASPANAQIDGSLYSRLNTRQKACYNALQDISIDEIMSAPVESGYRSVGVEVKGMTNLSLRGEISGGSFYPADSAARQAYDALYNDMHAAVIALYYDRPDMLWLDGGVLYSVRLFGWSGSGSVTVENVYYGFTLDYGGREKRMREEMMEHAQAIADEAGREPDTYSRLKKAHDLIALRSKYNHTPKSEMEEMLTHSPYSALVPDDPYEPVCDGYSKAMKLVCGLLDIPCLCVSSPTHMWNNIKMDDGLWYNLDLTWDDGLTSEPVDTYFLVGSHTVAQGKPFYQQESHEEISPFVEEGVNVPGAVYPTKNKEAYAYLGEDYPPTRFPDVTRDAWYYDAVESAAQQGYFKGDESGRFNPMKNITRAEFATVMANREGVDLENYPGWADFTDIQGRPWYSKAVAWASANGVMQGSGGAFRPVKNISRQEMCVVLYNSVLGQARPEKTWGAFTDDSAIAGWARDAVYACYEAGLVKGDQKGNFNPQASASRCEAAVMLDRLP